jgi:hypothetical protein
MAQRELTRREQLRFAEEAARIRYRNGRPTPFPPETLLEARRSVDIGDDLWRVYNVVHEHLMQGGDSGRSARGRSPAKPCHSRDLRECPNQHGPVATGPALDPQSRRVQTTNPQRLVRVTLPYIDGARHPNTFAACGSRPAIVRLTSPAMAREVRSHHAEDGAEI